MALIVMGSVKASPGVTTAALALCVAWPTRRWAVMIEADPAGGDLVARFGLGETPDVLSLAAASRHDRDAEALFDLFSGSGDDLVVGVSTGRPVWTVVADRGAILRVSMFCCRICVMWWSVRSSGPGTASWWRPARRRRRRCVQAAARGPAGCMAATGAACAMHRLAAARW